MTKSRRHSYSVDLYRHRCWFLITLRHCVCHRRQRCTQDAADRQRSAKTLNKISITACHYHGNRCVKYEYSSNSYLTCRCPPRSTGPVNVHRQFIHAWTGVTVDPPACNSLSHDIRTNHIQPYMFTHSVRHLESVKAHRCDSIKISGPTRWQVVRKLGLRYDMHVFRPILILSNASTTCYHQTKSAVICQGVRLSCD